MPASVAIGIAFGALSGGLSFAMGLTAAGVTLAAAVGGGALIGGVLSGLNYLLTPKPDLGALRADTRHTVTAAVSPARWILGRARVGGVLVFYRELDDADKPESNTADVHLVLVLAEGACEKIERIWIDGKELEFTRTPHPEWPGGGAWILPTDSSSYAEKKEGGGFIRIGEYFAADGRQGYSLRYYLSRVGNLATPPASDDSFDDFEWTNAHRLTGLSWVHVQLIQSVYGNNIDNRIWARLPEINFLVKGLKITWPGQATPVWTENAAAIRYWWLTQRRGIPAEAIDEASVRAAVSKCGEPVTAALPAGYEDYTPTSDRYTVNGVVYADDAPEHVEAELNFAWQGWAVEVAGIYHFRPGTDRPIARALVPDDILAIAGIQPAPALQDRLNAATLSLAQSREHDWLEASLPEFTDTAAEARDGERLSKDLGTRPFVADPIAGGRLLATQIRRTRASATFRYRLKPGPDLEWLGILPSDWITVTDPEHGLENFQAIVTRTVVNEDWSVTLDLVEQPNGVYADTLVLPPLKPRAIRIPNLRAVPPVTGLTADEIAEVQQDGTVLVFLVLTWVSVGARSQARWRQRGDTNWDTSEAIGGRIRIPGVLAGETYEYGMHNLNLHGFASDWTPTATQTIGGDLTPPEAPTGLTLTPLQGGYTVKWANPAADDYAFTEIYESPTSVTQFSRAAFLAEIAGTAWDRLGLGAATTVKVWIRHKDRSGNRGGTVSAQVTSLAAPKDGAPGARGQRARGDFYRATTESAWNSILANIATPGVNVISDTVTLYNESGRYVETRTWNGTAWIAVDKRIDGNVLFPGSVTANALAADTITVREISPALQEALTSKSMTWRGNWQPFTIYARQDAVLHDGASWISVQNGNLGQMPSISSGWWDPLSQRGEPGAPGAGSRGAGNYSATLTGTAKTWSNTVANGAVPGGVPVAGDYVTLLNLSQKYVETRRWTGSAWVAAIVTINGQLVVPGSIQAGAIAAGAITADKITADVPNSEVLFDGTLLLSETESDLAITLVALRAGTDVRKWKTLLFVLDAAAGHVCTALRINDLPLVPTQSVRIFVPPWINRSGEDVAASFRVARTASGSQLRFRADGEFRGTYNVYLKSVVGLKFPT